eukprot:Transcript_11895.p1 GENE.Transcript_11895~~Transcript_11895.p1  ORF type:complete len:385 (+),score=135.67 Transcript_11895:118-1272(+)
MRMRRVLILLLWCGDVCLYMARTNVSVAISQMFGKTTQEGELLSAFYWGYFLFQLPAGWLAPRVGAHRLLSAAVTVWSIASAASCFTGGSITAFFASADPAQHRCISDEERSYIQASRPPRPPYTKTPWRAILTNRPFLCTIACHVMYNWTFYIGLSWIDKFLESSWRATASAGTLAAASVVPYCCLFVLSALSGVVADDLESRFGFSPTHARKLVNSVGLLGGAAGFVALSLVAPTGGGGPRGSLMAATACLSVAIGMAGFGAAAGYWATFGDLSPRHGALLLALSNALASVPGIVGNTVVGNLLASTHNDWALVFQICAGTLVLGALVFLGAEARDQHLDERRGAGLAAKLLVADAAAAGEGEGLGAAGSVQAADASSSAGA